METYRQYSLLAARNRLQCCLLEEFIDTHSSNAILQLYIHYVLPVLWMTACSHIMGPAVATRRYCSSVCSVVHGLTPLLRGIGWAPRQDEPFLQGAPGSSLRYTIASFLTCGCLVTDRADDRRLEKHVSEAVPDAEHHDRLPRRHASPAAHSLHLQHRQLHAGGTDSRCKCHSIALNSYELQ